MIKALAKQIVLRNGGPYCGSLGCFQPFERATGDQVRNEENGSRLSHRANSGDFALAYFSQASLGNSLSFFVYLIWQTGVFFQVGFTLGNLNAYPQPMGHIAGFASSVTGGVSTVFAAFLQVL